MSKEAHIVAIKTGSLGDLGFGISAVPGDITQAFNSEVWIGPRPVLEKDNDFVQPIPYIVLRDGDKVLAYTRGVTTGEDRLHAKVSIGFGGHVDLGDALTDDFGVIQLADTMNAAARRELIEELGLDPATLDNVDLDVLFNWVAIIQSQATPVDAVHIGFVCIVDIAKLPLMNFGSFEDAIENAEWRTLDSFGTANLETWSALTVEALSDGRIA